MVLKPWLHSLGPRLDKNRLALLLHVLRMPAEQQSLGALFSEAGKMGCGDK